jgi:hypothetical protein
MSLRPQTNPLFNPAALSRYAEISLWFSKRLKAVRILSLPPASEKLEAKASMKGVGLLPSTLALRSLSISSGTPGKCIVSGSERILIENKLLTFSVHWLLPINLFSGGLLGTFGHKSAWGMG